MSAFLRRQLTIALAVALLLVGCQKKGTTTGQQVALLGFRFIVAETETETPPMEDLTVTPPTLGAPLNATIVFEFDGEPVGPFNATTLPIFTTFDDVTPEAFALPGSVIYAKGTYSQSGNRVEFEPFVPTAPLQIKLSAPPAAVPGLLPASVYTVLVSAIPGAKLGNLTGPGGTASFGTTSNAAAYYPSGGADALPPAVTATEPADGALDFFPNPFDNTPYGTAFPTFPAGDQEIVLSYDRALEPTFANIAGEDIDGDGVLEPSFWFRTAATRLLVGQTLGAGSTVGNGADTTAIGGVSIGLPVSSDGSAVFLHDGGAPIGGGTADLFARPKGMAMGPDGSLLFLLLEDAQGQDYLSVVDHALGDPSSAPLSAAFPIDDVVIETQTVALDLTGLTSLLDGRLVAYDRATRRIFELDPTVTRVLPHGQPVVAALRMRNESTNLGNQGDDLFRSQPQPVSLDILDLAQDEDGALYALADMPPGTGTPTIVRLNSVDANLDAIFDAADGLFVGAAGDTVMALTDVYSAFVFEQVGVALALNRTTDAIDRIDLELLTTAPVVSGVGGYGLDLSGFPEGLSPATTLAFGHAAIGVDVTLTANSSFGAEVHLAGRGLLPFGAAFDVMQRVTLRSLQGSSLANSLQDPQYALGAVRLMSLTTSAPTGSGDGVGSVHDVFFEDFLDKYFEDPQVGTLGTLAEWADPSIGAAPSGALRASVGVNTVAQLGDFRPVTPVGFNPGNAFKRGQTSNAGFDFVFLDTDTQSFPLPNGETPGITSPITVEGGKFNFDDFIIPEGVWVVVQGSKPLQITATGRVEIAGLLDVSGVDGLGDDTFNTGFIPVPGGVGGPGAGRGGHGHPSLFNPNSAGTLNQYVTPETGERGYGPLVGPLGTITFAKVGGHGGLSGAGYDPKKINDPTDPAHLFPKVPDGGNNTEHHRVPGGGGGSFYFHGMQAHNGASDYQVQSDSTWFPFNRCPTDNGIDDALYGNEENLLQGKNPNTPLQCVYRTYSPLKPGGAAGDLVFKDGDPSNDYFGPSGELTVLIGGQGGGGGASKVDSLAQNVWCCGLAGQPPNGGPTVPPPLPPPHYPKLFVGVFHAPTLYDAKGGGGGGGGGALLIRSFGDIVLTETGHIDASGGVGEGGEVVQNSTFGGGGGGGSGGAVILQAAGEIIIRADEDHIQPWWDDSDGARGAAIDVSGGTGFDARTQPTQIFSKQAFTYDFTRSDGGQGGFGLIQLQEGTVDGIPQVEQGAYLFASQRVVLKSGPWVQDPEEGSMILDQREHPQFSGNNAPSDELRYIDMLHYRPFIYDDKPVGTGSNAIDHYILLNGSFPGIVAEAGSGALRPYQLDTEMVWHEPLGKYLVREMQPERIFRTYVPYDPVTFKEASVGVNGEPGQLFSPTDAIPLSVYLQEPSGKPFYEDEEETTWDRDNVIDRLPVIHPSVTPPPFGAASRGTSKWLDFTGVLLRTRNAEGVSPPFFDGVNGTFNALVGGYQPENEARVIAVQNVPGKPARFVANTPGAPFDPKLVIDGSTTGEPFNDIRVDAPELSIENAVTNNAAVSLRFQGAFPVRIGSDVANVDTLTDWVADLRELSGYPLVRFQVVFDLSMDTSAFPFGLESFRPGVDYVRVRARY